ncbi:MULTISPECIES: DUF4265 domain-containing protein [Curtobacterium]|uniref:DUF4265 domain-containing protein n=1 Tax=Curtobacterium TaxID=2034 RepID=UPI00217D7145|nr:DUF4265 domain-containing protein [Curtobacterium flaccumfaciens]MCS6561240.1 DUF4265 domain-containing protein [Curtobacterium flaccumfaciens pv. poinsettiae]UXN29411.1 DUF4265 domain-containing protein [Curtobacterium flaccumfaciens]
MHPNPVWAGRVDFVADATIAEDPTSPLQFEQLLFRDLGDGTHQLCCIPFFTYGWSLGDRVRLEERDGVGPMPTAVLERSAFWVLRAFVERDDAAAALLELLQRNDALVETRGRLVAFAVEGTQRLAAVREALEALQRPDFLSYETGWL